MRRIKIVTVVMVGIVLLTGCGQVNIPDTPQVTQEEVDEFFDHARAKGEDTVTDTEGVEEINDQQDSADPIDINDMNVEELINIPVSRVIDVQREWTNAFADNLDKQLTDMKYECYYAKTLVNTYCASNDISQPIMCEDIRYPLDVQLDRLDMVYIDSDGKADQVIYTDNSTYKLAIETDSVQVTDFIRKTNGEHYFTIFDPCDDYTLRTERNIEDIFPNGFWYYNKGVIVYNSDNELVCKLGDLPYEEGNLPIQEYDDFLNSHSVAFIKEDESIWSVVRYSESIYGYKVMTFYKYKGPGIDEVVYYKDFYAFLMPDDSQADETVEEASKQHENDDTEVIKNYMFDLLTPYADKLEMRLATYKTTYLDAEKLLKDDFSVTFNSMEDGAITVALPNGTECFSNDPGIYFPFDADVVDEEVSRLLQSGDSFGFVEYDLFHDNIPIYAAIYLTEDKEAVIVLSADAEDLQFLLGQ